MEIRALISLKVVLNNKEYEFSFENGCPSVDASKALLDIQRKIIDMGQNPIENTNDSASKEKKCSNVDSSCTNSEVLESS